MHVTNNQCVNVGNAAKVTSASTGTGVVIVGNNAPLGYEMLGVPSTHPVAVAVSSVAGVLAINAALANGCAKTLMTENITSMTVSNPLGSGQVLTVVVQQDGTGTFTVAWPATFKFAGGVAPVCAGAWKLTLVTMLWLGLGATTWKEISRAENVAN